MTFGELFIICLIIAYIGFTAFVFITKAYIEDEDIEYKEKIEKSY